MVRRYRLKQRLSLEDQDFVFREILAYHPQAEVKIGCGVEAIEVGSPGLLHPGW
jgi:hypothetical protein